ncbi:MAG: hypothetical protein HFACDABA_02029 [Anaerolineales bacterium]|nr:hypothetical protein [Anaerolineales bacterium]
MNTAERKYYYYRPLILAYHSVSDRYDGNLAVPPAVFERQMAFLSQRGYRSMTLETFVRQPLARPEKIVILTFDDGYADNHAVAFPILKKYGLTGTIFVTADYVNTDHIYSWDKNRIKSPEDEAAYRLLTLDQIFEMMEYGMEFGSHTSTHAILPILSEEQCWREIHASRESLSRMLDQPVTSFCYPEGKLNDRIVQMVAGAGYACGVVTPPRAGLPLSRYTLRRAGVYRSTSPLAFRLKMSPFVMRYRELFMQRQSGSAVSA